MKRNVPVWMQRAVLLGLVVGLQACMLSGRFRGGTAYYGSDYSYRARGYYAQQYVAAPAVTQTYVAPTYSQTYVVPSYAPQPVVVVQQPQPQTVYVVQQQQPATVYVQQSGASPCAPAAPVAVGGTMTASAAATVDVGEIAIVR